MKMTTSSGLSLHRRGYAPNLHMLSPYTINSTSAIPFACYAHVSGASHAGAGLSFQGQRSHMYNRVAVVLRAVAFASCHNHGFRGLNFGTHSCRSRCLCHRRRVCRYCWLLRAVLKRTLTRGRITSTWFRASTSFYSIVLGAPRSEHKTVKRIPKAFWGSTVLNMVLQDG